MKKKFMTLVALLAVPAMLAAACGNDDDASGDTTATTTVDGATTTGGADTTAERPSELVHMTIGSQDPKALPALAFMVLAQEQGFWEEEGIELEILPGQGGGNIVQALIAGSTDLAISNPSAMVPAFLGGAEITLLGSWYDFTAVDFLTFDPDATEQGAILGYSSAGSLGNFMVDAYAADNPELGITGQAVGGLGDLVAAAREGRITAFNITPPYTAQFEADGGRVLIRGQDMVGDTSTGIVGVRNDYAAEHPEALEAFWRVLDRVYQYVLEDPERAASQLAVILEADEGFVLDAITGDYADGFTIEQDLDALSNTGDLLLRAGVVSEPVDWAAIIDQQYLPESARGDLESISPAA